MAADLDFYMAPYTRSGTVHWLLEELGVPYNRHVLDLKKGEHKSPAYLAINPMGKVPAIVHRGVPVSEMAAICCYLADAFAEAGLSVPIGDPARGPYLKWLFFAPGCIEPAVTDRLLQRSSGPAPQLGYGDFDTLLGVLTRAVARGPYLLGERFTAADVVVGSALRWAMMAGGIPERPELAAYVAQLVERPAFERASAREAELAAAQKG